MYHTPSQVHEEQCVNTTPTRDETGRADQRRMDWRVSKEVGGGEKEIIKQIHF